MKDPNVSVNKTLWNPDGILLGKFTTSTTLFCLISAGCLLELCVAVTFYRHYRYYQLNYIIFFGVHTNYLCYLSKNWHSQGRL